MSSDDLSPEELRKLRRRSRRSFIVGGVAAISGLGAFAWLKSRPEDDGEPWPLRRVLEINEKFARGYFKNARLAPEFPLAAAGEPKENGNIGMDFKIDPDSWSLDVSGSREGAIPDDGLSLDDVKALPHVEMTTELKCIEGWSKVVHWGGARFSDFARRYGPEAMTRYVSMETPDSEYFVGLDSDSAMHPQTLLAYEMNGQPLTDAHGAPLRLVIPVKYGIKNIKRIGTISFTDDRPRDYWAEDGYDWYAGH